MNFITNTLETIKGSFYSKEFYAKLPAKSRARSVLCLFAIVVGLEVGIPALIGIHAFMNSGVIQKSIDTYPTDLVVEIKDGIVSTNQAQPFFIAMPERTASSSPQNLVAIDTTPDLALAKISSYDAAMVVTRTSVVYRSDNETRIADLSKIKELKLDRATVVGFVEKVKPYISALAYLLPALLFLLVSLVVFGYYLFIALPSALILKVVAAIKGFSVPFSEAYHISLFALIPVEIVNFGLGLFGASSGWINILVFISVIALTLQKPEVKSE